MFDWIRKMGKTKGDDKTKDDRQFEILDGRLIDLEGKLRKFRADVKENQQANQLKFAQLETLIKSGFQEVLEAIAKIQPLPQPQPKPLEVKFVFKVANDHQDEPYSISIGGVTDVEGEPLPDTKGLTVEVVSSDEAVVSAGFDPSTNSGVAHFGHSGVASLTATVKNAKGDILGSGAADFTVTTGDPAAVSDVRIAFGGLTEEPPAGPAPEG